MIDILLIVLVIMSLGAILGGFYMRFQAPKDNEMKMGVLTQRAKASSEIWKYANRACGKRWLITGILYLILGIPVILLMYHFKGEYPAQALSMIYLIFEIIILASSVTAVLREINSKFDEKGNLKENVVE